MRKNSPDDGKRVRLNYESFSYKYFSVKAKLTEELRGNDLPTTMSQEQRRRLPVRGNSDALHCPVVAYNDCEPPYLKLSGV